MATRRPRRRRRQTEDEELEGVVEEETAEEDPEAENEETEDDAAEVEDEPEEEALAPKRRRRRRAAPKPEPVEEEPEDEAPEGDEPEETQAPAKRSRRRSREETEEAKATMAEADGAFFAGIIDALNSGTSLMISKLDDGRIVVTMQNSVVTKAKKPKRVLSEEFKAFKSDWSMKSYEEKLEEAEDLGVLWNEHENESVNVMRLTIAVRKELGVEKYAD